MGVMVIALFRPKPGGVGLERIAVLFVGASDCCRLASVSWSGCEPAGSAAGEPPHRNGAVLRALL